jgi:1,4-alpha-glucan branching enzyme
LRADNVHAYYISDNDRILAYHRWIDGTGQDVIVVASLAETAYYAYDLGFPIAGAWAELFNSDVYDNFINPTPTGNGGSITAGSTPLHGFAASAPITIPANGVLVFSRAT